MGLPLHDYGYVVYGYVLGLSSSGLHITWLNRCHVLRTETSGRTPFPHPTTSPSRVRSQPSPTLRPSLPTYRSHGPHKIEIFQCPGRITHTAHQTKIDIPHASSPARAHTTVSRSKCTSTQPKAHADAVTAHGMMHTAEDYA